MKLIDLKPEDLFSALIDVMFKEVSDQIKNGTCYAVSKMTANGNRIQLSVGKIQSSELHHYKVLGILKTDKIQEDDNAA